MLPVRLTAPKPDSQGGRYWCEQLRLALAFFVPESKPQNLEGWPQKPGMFNPRTVGDRDYVPGPFRWIPLGSPSEHAFCDAVDFMIADFNVDPADRTKTGDKVAYTLVTLAANGVAIGNGALAGAGYIDNVIWNRRIWSLANPQWHDYHGVSNHTDHIHCGIRRPGSPFGYDSTCIKNR